MDATLTLLLTAFSYIAICPIMPRFIISVRELYEHDIRGRWQGIDTGFGVLSQPSRENAAMSVVAFSDVALLGQSRIVAMEGDVDESESELLVEN